MTKSLLIWETFLYAMGISGAISLASPPSRSRQLIILLVPPYHQQKIHLDREYPCPCCAKGKIQHIILTEAFGCDRCNRIFVMQSDNLTIEELAATYPYKRRYYWDGQRLQSVKSLKNVTVGRWLHRSTGASPDRWSIWVQCLGIIAAIPILLRLYSRLAVTSPLLSLVLSMTIAIVVLIVIILWLFDQG